MLPRVFFATSFSTSASGSETTSPAARSRVDDCTSQTADVEATATTVNLATTPGSTAELVLSVFGLRRILLEHELRALRKTSVAPGVDVYVGAADVADVEACSDWSCCSRGSCRNRVRSGFRLLGDTERRNKKG